MFLSKIVTLNIILPSNCHFEVLLNYIVPFYRIFVVFFVMCPIIVTICGIWQFYLHGGLLLYFTDFCFVDRLIYQSNQLTVTLTFLCVLFCYNLRTKTSRAPNPKNKTNLDLQFYFCLHGYILLEWQGATRPSFKFPSLIATQTLVFINLKEAYVGLQDLATYKEMDRRRERHFE